MSATATTSWRDRPIGDLKVPKGTKKHLKEAATMPSGDGVTCWGDVWDALEESHDIGLGDLQEKVRAQIEDAKNAEEAAEAGEQTEAVPPPEAVPIPEAVPMPDAAPPESENAGDIARQIAEAAVPRVACGTCHGTGLIEENRCPGCNGEGTVIDQSAIIEPDIGPLPNCDPDRAMLLDQIIEAEKLVQAAEREMNARHEEYKDAKKDFELTVSKLRQVIRQSQEPAEPNLFSGVKPSKNGKPHKADEKDESNADPRLENLWRDYPLERYTRFDLPASVIQKLAEHSPPILTVGELADFTLPKPGGYTPRLTDVKGVGKAKVQLIEEAGEKFWAWWRAGGEGEFAKEKGLADVDGHTAGVGGESSGPIEPGEALADDWSEPGPSDRPEA